MNILGALIFLNHWKILHKFFGTVRKKQSTESWYLIIQKLFDTISFQKHKDPPTKFFGTVRQKGSTESWYPYYPKNLETRIIMNHRRVRPRWFLAMWDKKLRKIVIPLLSKKFWYQKVSETQRVAYDVFRQFGTKKLRRINVTPPTYSKTFSVLELFWKTKAFPHEVFRYCETKSSSWKIVKVPYFHEIFGCPKLFESMEGSPQVFWYCKTKTIDRIVIPLLSKKFWNKNNSEAQTGSPAMILGDVRQKNSTKLLYPYYPKCFDTRIILKHRRVRSQWFLAMWDKKNWQNCDSPIM